MLSRRLLIGSVLGAAAARSIVRSSAADDACAHLRSWPVAPGDHPHDVAPAADSVRIWYTAQHAGAMGLLDPLTGDVERIALGEGSAPHGVIVGPDRAAWITDGGRDEIVRVDGDSFEVTAFSIGRTGARLNTAAFDGDGALWFTGQAGVVGRLDVERGEILLSDAPRGRGPYGICATPGGEVWFVSLAGSYLAHVRLQDGEIELDLFDPPTAGAGLRRVWSDSHGRLWIAEWNAGQVARFDPAEETWREWRLPGDAPQAYAVYVDEVDHVWLTDFSANAIVRFDPESEQFSPFELPHAGGQVRQLLGRDGQVWGGESGADHLAMIDTVCAGP